MNSESKEDKLRDICESIFHKYKEDNVKEAFNLILKLLGNIVSKPEEQKFRQFKKTNEAIKSKILIIKESVQLMKEIGYVDLDSEFMAFQESDTSNIKTAIKVLNDYIEIINKMIAEGEYMAELKRQEDIKKLNEEVNRKIKEEKLRQQKIKEQLEYDKKEREKLEKPTDSNANNLTFGAKVCKFEPKNTGGGRG